MAAGGHHDGHGSPFRDYIVNSAHTPRRTDWHLVGACGIAAMVVVSLLSAAVNEGLKNRSIAWGLITLAVAIGAWLAVRHQEAVWLRLIWPAQGLVLLYSFRFLQEGTAQLLPGFLTLIALYCGLTQPPWRSLIPLPFSLLVLYTILPLQNEGAAIRIAISAVTLSAVSELPARLMAQLSRNHSALAQTSEIDVLTGALNRRRLPALLREFDNQAYVVMIDLDHFKAHNDDNGHLAGDQTLADFATMLRGQSRASDYVVRYGGEEFLVILVDADIEATTRAAARWAEAWQQASGMTFSAGIAQLNGPDSLSRADKALYEAKAAGRDRAVLAPPRARASGPR